MDFSREQMEAVEKYASIYLPISDMAILLDIPADILRDEIRNKSSEVSRAYHRGKAASWKPCSPCSRLLPYRCLGHLAGIYGTEQLTAYPKG